MAKRVTPCIFLSCGKEVKSAGDQSHEAKAKRIIRVADTLGQSLHTKTPHETPASRKSRLEKPRPQKSPNRIKPRPGKQTAAQVKQTPEQTRLKQNLPQTKPRPTTTRPSKKTRLEKNPPVLLFGRKCFCSAAGAFVSPQVLSIGRRCFCLVAGVFVWPQGVFARPQVLLFDRPPARRPRLRRIEF